eukprot:scaffold1168_cov167-Amphora_coffeaeformis.AAC.15
MLACISLLPRRAASIVVKDGASRARVLFSKLSMEKAGQSSTLLEFSTKIGYGSRRDYRTSIQWARSLSTTTTTTPVSPATTPTPPENEKDIDAVRKDPLEGLFSTPISLPRIYRYFGLKTFSEDEIGGVFERIAAQNSTDLDTGGSSITRQQMQGFLLERIHKMEEESDEISPETPEAEFLRQKFVEMESERIWKSLLVGEGVENHTSIDKKEFIHTIRKKATQVDFVRTLPIISSMLIVGASVGVITPAMPFVVENLGLSASQYGLVVSAFALSKMAANIPSAIAVERHGRKPYMVHSLLVISLGVGGIGIANSFEELYLCRLLTGTGVSFLSGAATMMLTDMSTPLNRASTLAPVMSAFAAGTALGPAIGGYLVDYVGLNPTFYLVGLSYLGVAALNRAILEETKIRTLHFPWQEPAPSLPKSKTLYESVQEAVGQWIPLMRDKNVRNIMIMNGLYWVALAGSQMTLLPLLLTDSAGLDFSATQVGQVYMGMSLVQIFGNPLFAKLIDKMGKAPAIVGGCTLISASMAALPFCHDWTQLAGVLGVWSMGSSMLSTAPIAFLSDHVSEENRAQAIALLRTCGDVGFLIGASGVGALADVTGMGVAIQSTSAVLFSATTWFAARQVLSNQIKSSTTKID